MDTTEKMAEKYPEVYFSHGTGYKSNGKNFTNYFGRIYRIMVFSGIVQDETRSPARLDMLQPRILQIQR